ncbi:hypothetical protein N8I77_008133 [Diaporthe amygdali]|uniref:Uncharacterized protein n=1 Tax=Phomopsis amygdali TaxID=1214568 RepID=A0AAD9SEA8_PHOAM|nr:hypothetical protein N8I77_008133 [Diaporthe amygdali]
MQAIEGVTARIQSPALSLSTLMADDLIDKTGIPIPLEYRKLWVTKASENDKRLGKLSEDDLDAIHHHIAPSAIQEERASGASYTYSGFPTDDKHAGLRDAKIVPIRLNLDAGEVFNSFAGDRALQFNDFTALSTKGLPDEASSEMLQRWRIYDKKGRMLRHYPSHYLVWEDPVDKRLYARVPKPLEGFSRGACDHCRIHDQAREDEYVEYVDDRPQVDGIRAMSTGDTAVTPFCLCRYHWWFIWSGELLRPSQVLAIELLVGGDLRDRWGLSHMREFLRFMDCRIRDLEALADNDTLGGPNDTGNSTQSTSGLTLPHPNASGRSARLRVLRRLAMLAALRHGVPLPPPKSCYDEFFAANGNSIRPAHSEPSVDASTLAPEQRTKTPVGFVESLQKILQTDDSVSTPAPESPSDATVGPAGPPQTDGSAPKSAMDYAAAARTDLNGQPASFADEVIAPLHSAAAAQQQANGTPAPAPALTHDGGPPLLPPTEPLAMRKGKRRRGTGARGGGRRTIWKGREKKDDMGRDGDMNGSASGVGV